MKSPDKLQWSIGRVMFIVFLFGISFGVLNLIFYESGKFVSTTKTNFFLPIKLLGRSESLTTLALISTGLAFAALVVNQIKKTKSFGMMAYFAVVLVFMFLDVMSHQSNFWMAYSFYRPTPIYLGQCLVFMIAEGIIRKSDRWHWVGVAFCLAHAAISWWMISSFVLNV